MREKGQKKEDGKDLTNKQRKKENEREIHAPQTHNMIKNSHQITSNTLETTATTYCQNQSSWIWFLPKTDAPNCFYP